MKGSKCRCGFRTTAVRARCPRCGKPLKAVYWPNQGKVASYIKLGVVPEGHDFPMDLLLVDIEDGPRIVCWTDTLFSVDENVTFVPLEEGYICSPKCDIQSVLPTEEGSERDVGDRNERELRSQ